VALLFVGWDGLEEYVIANDDDVGGTISVLGWRPCIAESYEEEDSQDPYI